MKKKRNHNSVLLGMLVCVVIALGVTVCGFWIMRKQLNETKNGQAQEKVYQKHYAFIVENPEDEFWENVYQAAKAHGEKQGIYVERISDYLSGDLSVKDYVEAAIAQQVDGILLQSSAKEVGEAMNEAMNQKIPVVTMLHDNYNGKRCSFLGINEVDIGKQYVSLVQKAVSKKKKNVCILTENAKGMGDHRLVIQTIRQQVKDADVKIVSVDADTEFGMEKAVRNLVKDRLNPKLTINGVVFTMYDGRTNLSMQVIENVRNNLNQTIYDTIIPRGVRLAEAPSHGLPITQYDNRSTGAKAYMALAKEVIERSAK